MQTHPPNEKSCILFSEASLNIVESAIPPAAPTARVLRKSCSDSTRKRFADETLSRMLNLISPWLITQLLAQ